MKPRLTFGKMQNPVRGFLHGSAAVVSVVAAVLLVLRAPTWGSRTAVMIFGLGLIALYTTSSLYHSINWSELWKGRMQRLDHVMIVVLIASTYTPIALIVLDGPLRWITIAGTWGTVAFLTLQHSLFPRASQALSIALMTTMGWLGVLLMWPIFTRGGLGVVLFAGLGGIAYTIGMIFMVTGKPKLWPHVFSSHELFHVLVIAGSALHFVMTWRYVVPLAA